MNNRQLPTPSTSLDVNIEGAEIVDDDSAETRDIYLPKHTEFISHIALDIGGSLAKVVYFTRSNYSKHEAVSAVLNDASTPPGTPMLNSPRPNGFLGPKAIGSATKGTVRQTPTAHTLKTRLRRRSSSSYVPGGRLNFIKFETDQIEECIEFISKLITSSAILNGVAVEQMKKSVTILATGGGAHLYYDKLVNDLGVEVRREEEMACLITGLSFITEIPNEVYWYSDELVEAVSHPNRPSSPSSPPLLLTPSPSASTLSISNAELPRPSPDPPHYSLVFDAHPKPQYPCMLVNIGSGVSIIKMDEQGHFERISGTSLGGGTLWGILSLITGAESFDEMLALSDKGDNSTVDMLVGDIYGSDYSKIGLKSSTIASSFGKVFRKGRAKKQWRPEDISRSLLYAISNNIGQIAYMNAEKHGLDRIYFGGCFIRGHAATMATLSYAIRFWSKGTKRALFLRHEGFLGAIGAWLHSELAHEAVNGDAMR